MPKFVLPLSIPFWAKVSVEAESLSEAINDFNRNGLPQEIENALALMGVPVVHGDVKDLQYAGHPTLDTEQVELYNSYDDMQSLIKTEEDDEDGTSGQDRKSYSDDQDREHYTT